MARTALQVVLVVILAIASARYAEAVKSSVTSYVTSTLVAKHSKYPPEYDPSIPAANQECSYEGVCFPSTQTVANATLWLWCGFDSTYRTYITWSAKQNLTSGIIREKHFYSCIEENTIANFSKCKTLANSVVDTKAKANMRVYGFAFHDPTCFFILNNNKTSPATFTVQVVGAYDSARYYGVVFIITILTLSCLWLLYFFYTNIAREIRRPIVDKGHPISAANEQSKFPGNNDEGVPLPTFKQRLSRKLSSSVLGKLLSNKNTSNPANPR